MYFGDKMTNETVNIKIGKMACNMCVTNVEEALAKIDGIKTFNVSLDDSNAIIEYDSNKTTINDMKKAIKDAGYEYLGEN